jgi:hypothetical protein
MTDEFDHYSRALELMGRAESGNSDGSSSNDALLAIMHAILALRETIMVLTACVSLDRDPPAFNVIKANEP